VADAVRIALLARAGKARDQLHMVLSEAGANIVAEGDPSQLEPSQVASHRPNYFLVSLEPAMEAALERFDELFAGEDVEVMFDDAEVTSRLDGWDLNRWARHVASKVLSNSDLLPPAPEGTPDWSAQDRGADTGESVVLQDDEDDDLSDSVSLDSAAMASTDGGLDFDLSLDDNDLGLPSGSAGDMAAIPEFGELDFDESVSFSSFNPSEHNGTELDLDVAELAAQLESFDKNQSRFRNDSDLPAPAIRQSVDEMIAAVGAQGIEEIEAVEAFDAPEPVAASPHVAAMAERAATIESPTFDFSHLELTPMDGAPPVAAAAVPAVTAGAGAVVILAGLGGPDAVRQLLSSLPDSLPVPVLLYQHLEVGKHERLVDQLAKISKLPVLLAREGDRPKAGHVSLLPAGLSARVSGDALAFAAGTLVELLASVSPEDSMVVVLSGADPQLVPAILAVRDAGGLVLAQDPEVCFDSVAADAMQRQGTPVFPALGLARQVASRWPA
jgi:chemosensory pili system protein ChpB (putative protein-glutamate methylesterase)